MSSEKSADPSCSSTIFHWNPTIQCDMVSNNNITGYILFVHWLREVLSANCMFFGKHWLICPSGPEDFFFTYYLLFSFGEESVNLFKHFEFPLSNYTLCQVCLKLDPWSLRRGHF